jgi:hypothetical protein
MEPDGPHWVRLANSRSIRELVLEYGWWYELSVLTGRFPPGTPEECYQNATLPTVEDGSLTSGPRPHDADRGRQLYLQLTMDH